MNSKLTASLAALAVCFQTTTHAFSLLGQFEQQPLGDSEINLFRWEGAGEEAIGSPMDLSEGYRWNVPILTYGFDKSFVDYFGPEGVAAVKQAIQFLNDLPPASQIVLSNYTLNSRFVNLTAGSQGLVDLKSETLGLLLEQMGLAQPTRHIFQLVMLDSLLLQFPSEDMWPSGTVPLRVHQRNFDPQSLLPSPYVNSVLFTGTLVHFGTEPPALNNSDIVEIPVDPSAIPAYASADQHHNVGEFVSGLTQDDAGGLRYLLSPDNIEYEPLLPFVRLRDPGFARPPYAAVIRGRRTVAVNHAFRAGVDKIVFVPHLFVKKTGAWRVFTYNYVDRFITNDVVNKQKLQRTVFRPDFVFSAADLGVGQATTPVYARTETSNWINDSGLFEADTGGASIESSSGPGIIRPQVKITLQKLGPTIFTGHRYPYYVDDISNRLDLAWGSFNNSTNEPIAFPGSTFTNALLTVRLRYWNNEGPQTTLVTNRTFHLFVPIGGSVALQTSTNQINWTSVAFVANEGRVVEWNHQDRTNPPTYFRILR
jgi:hypothetical protein